jgi:hypothetical protein
MGRYRLMILDRSELLAVLGDVPLEGSEEAAGRTVHLQVPLPDGTFKEFRVEESPILAPSLAAKFPQIKSYHGTGVPDGSSARFTITSKGFHGILDSASGTDRELHRG